MGLLDSINPLNVIDNLTERNWAKRDASDLAQANERGAERAMDFSSAEALANRNWQEHMSNTSWQRGTADMMAAGINPMLAFQKGGASTPGGGQGSGSAAQGAQTRGTAFSLTNALTSAAQIDNIKADTEQKRAAAQEITAKTPTHAANIGLTEQQTAESQKKVERMDQEISESKERIQKLIQEVKTSASSAAHMDQQAINLRAELPRITADIKRIIESAQQLTAGTKEINQRVRANLPALQAALNDLERIARVAQQPRQAQDEITHSGFLGSMSAAIRALTGLGAHTNIGR